MLGAAMAPGAESPAYGRDQFQSALATSQACPCAARIATCCRDRIRQPHARLARIRSRIAQEQAECNFPE